MYVYVSLHLLAQRFFVFSKYLLPLQLKFVVKCYQIFCVILLSLPPLSLSLSLLSLPLSLLSGPCPPCPKTISVSCYCGRGGSVVKRCGSSGWSCGRVCRKILSCTQHVCESKCHKGEWIYYISSM